MQYELSPAGKERIARIAERNELPLPAALEALLLLADLGKWTLEDGLAQPCGPALEARRQTPLASLTISARLKNALAFNDHVSPYGTKQGHMATVEALAALPLAELLKTRGMGKKSLKEWSDCLVKFGYPPLSI